MAEKLKKAAAQVAKRRGNFTTEEVEILLNEVDRRKSVLFAKFSNNITNQLKIKHWTYESTVHRLMFRDDYSCP